MNQPTSTPKAPENVLLGTLGAILFALAGGIVYFVLWSIGIIAALSGIVAVLCAIKGYEIFSRGRSKRGITIAVIASAVVLVLAWYICFCTDLHAAYQGWYEAGEVDYLPTLGECILYGYYDLTVNPGYFVDLLLSLAMAALGCWGYVKRTLNAQEEANVRQAQQNRTAELARLQAEQAGQAQPTEQTVPPTEIPTEIPTETPAEDGTESNE